MGNKNKAKGTSFETAIREYLNNNGFAKAHRTALEGGQDKGDIHGVEQTIHSLGGVTIVRKACIQCKNQKTFKLSEWLNDTVEQATRLDDALPILVVKRPGKGDKALGDSYAVMRLSDIIAILKDAGFC
jgi:Holliday junction resolvase